MIYPFYQSSTISTPNFKKKQSLSAAISKICLGAGLNLLAGTLAYAQNGNVEEIVINETSARDYRIEQASLSKFTELLLDTPQSITAISSELMEDRGMTSLDGVLRNVPGITLGAGEFSWQGNSPNIRGFSSRNDMFLDGMRDFGSYARDPFNLDAVEVLFGPSSMAFGRGSTGGVINQTSKRAKAAASRAVHLNVGNADTRRVTVDVNQPFEAMGATNGLRLNLMKHDSGVAGRDGAENARYGIAPSLTLGLGSATQLTLSYMKQKSEHTPDYGLPWIAGEPAKVRQENFYGFGSDYLNTDADISTITLDHTINNNFSANAQIRYADYSRQSRITEPKVSSLVTAETPLDNVVVERNVFNGESKERMLQGQFNLLADFQTGSVEHSLVTGLEIANESSAPSFAFGIGVPSTSLLAPIDSGFSATALAQRLKADSEANSMAAFVLDTIKFNESWQLMAGLRWDSFEIDYIADRFEDDGTPIGREQIKRKDIEKSYRLALVYKPVETGTVYLAWGTSFNPSSEGLSFINSGRNLTISNAYLDPETNETLELGTKWELLNGGLSVDAALFHIEKSNARVPDPENPGFNALGGEQEVNGFAINMVGTITERLSLSGGYTYLDSEQKKTTKLTVPPGAPLTNVAKNAFSLWLNYDIFDQVQIAGGARYLGARLATNAGLQKKVPDYWVFDAMAKYRVTEKISVKLNLTNITDELYYDQLHPWHVIPGPGFTSMLAVNFDF